MPDFASSYVGQLRKLVGTRLLLVPGARIVVERPSGEILLQKRTDFDLWGLPGGNAEEGEGLETAIIRRRRNWPGGLRFEAFRFWLRSRHRDLHFRQWRSLPVFRSQLLYSLLLGVAKGL